MKSFSYPHKINQEVCRRANPTNTLCFFYKNILFLFEPRVFLTFLRIEPYSYDILGYQLSQGIFLKIVMKIPE